jgi:hypothetical protein
MAPGTNYGTSATPRRNMMNIKTTTLFNNDQGTQNIHLIFTLDMTTLQLNILYTGNHNL